MKKSIIFIAAFCSAAVLCAAELARPELIIRPAGQKCGEKCSPLCGYIFRIKAMIPEDFNRLPDEKAAVKCSMDNENLYVDVYMADRDVLCEAPDPSMARLYNVADAVQILIKSEKSDPLWEINVTAGKVCNAFIYPGPGVVLPGFAEKLEIKSEVRIDGTLNNSKDVDKSWSVRTVIPLNILRRNGLKFVDSENWTMLVSRNNYGRSISGREWSSYPQIVLTQYDATRFARLSFPEK